MTAAPQYLQSILDEAFAGIDTARESFAAGLTPREVGTITNVSTGIARVSGLPGVGFEELLEFPGKVFGIAFNVDEEEIGVVLLGDYWHLHAGDEVTRTGRVMDVAVGDGLLAKRSIRSAGRSTTKGRRPPASACRSRGPPPPSWTARPSQCRCRPA